MNNSNIDVDIIDETLLYICIDGKREHISYDNARIKYAKNKQVLAMIDDVLLRYKENSEPLQEPKEQPEQNHDVQKTEFTLEDLNNSPLEDSNPPSGNPTPTVATMPDIKDLNDKPLEPVAQPAIHREVKGAEKKVELKDLNGAPLVDEAKLADIYNKFNSRIRETFPTDSPSFLDVEKLTRNSKPLEQTR